MKARQYINMMGMTAVVLLSSCVKDELHDTPHPDYGKITVTADWTDRGDGVDIPVEWAVTMSDYTGTETGETHAPDYLFNPGSYTLAAYNTPENITVSGTTATVAKAHGDAADLFIVEADTDYDLTAAMHQQVRELNIIIEPTGDAAGRIESIEGLLSGAAGTLDFATGTYGAASDVALHFTRITEGEDAGKWTATVRLLGITGNTQTLTATLTYADGNPADTGLESDLTEALADFNADKTVPLTLGGEAVVPDEAGVTATIDDWQPGNDGGEDVNIH